MTRAILHLDLDSFFVSVERIKDPSLVGKPLIIGGRSDRGVVASCSYETRAFGVTSAMPIAKARKLCPQAIIIGGDMESYSHYSRMVTQIIKQESPLFEKSSIDEFYIDLTGMDKFFGCVKWSQELRNKIIRETGLPISCGLSGNKLISKMATNEAKPNGFLHIPLGKEKDFIAAMPVGKIPMVGEKTEEALHKIGVKTIGQLSEIPAELLEEKFGSMGLSLWRRANGISGAEVVPYHEPKSMSQERTFHKDMSDRYYMHTMVARMTENLAYDLRDIKKLTGCVALKIRYPDFHTVSLQKSIPLTANDDVLIKTARELFDKLHDQKQKVRLIGVRFSHLCQGEQQISIFDNTAERAGLYKAMDKIRNKFGSTSVKRAEGI